MLHGSQIAESYGSPLIPFDILPSGRIPPPPQKARWGSPLGAIHFLKVVGTAAQWDSHLFSLCWYRRVLGLLAFCSSDWCKIKAGPLASRELSVTNHN